MDDGGERSGVGGEGRRPRSRKRTEQALFAAVRRLLSRDGILAGLSLQEVAKEARVNRGQIYQLFGTRRDLVRASLANVVAERVLADRAMRELPFRKRRSRMFTTVLQHREWAHLAALLALDGDTEWSLMPEFSRSLADLDRDKMSGELPPDADSAALHITTSALQLGYAVFREAYSRDSGIPVDELDVRVRAAYESILQGFVSQGSASPRSRSPASSAD